MTLFLSESDVQELLTPADAVEAVEGAFRRMAGGAVEIAPASQAEELARGRLPGGMGTSGFELGSAAAVKVRTGRLRDGRGLR